MSVSVVVSCGGFCGWSCVGCCFRDAVELWWRCGSGGDAWFRGGVTLVL